MSDYKPVACAVSDVLEAAIVQGRPLKIELKESVPHQHQWLEIDPLDIAVEEGAEFLRYRLRKGGLEGQVRLDAIRRIEEIGK